jgi:hypothetical protein
MVMEFRSQLPGNQINTTVQAEELAKLLSDAAIDKFKNPKGKKTPYQRKYKKTYNATWEVSILFILGLHYFTIFYLCRVAKKTISLSSFLLLEKSDRTTEFGKIIKQFNKSRQKIYLKIKIILYLIN